MSRGLGILLCLTFTSIALIFVFSGQLGQNYRIATESLKQQQSVLNIVQPTVDSNHQNDSAPLVIYNRVDKCGSRSLIEITKKLGEMKGYYYHGRKYAKGTYRLSEHRLKREISFIKSLHRPGVYAPHLYYLNFEQQHFDFPIIYINIIRDPINRFVSDYNFQLFGDNRVARKTLIDPMDINKCVLMKSKKCRPTFHIGHFFCGHQKQCFEKSKALSVAEQTIERDYAVVGLTEEFNATLAVLEKVLPEFYEGARAVWDKIQKDVIGDMKSKKRFTLTQSSREVMRTRLQKDYILYHWVKARFYDQKRKFGIE